MHGQTILKIKGNPMHLEFGMSFKIKFDSSHFFSKFEYFYYILYEN